MIKLPHSSISFPSHVLIQSRLQLQSIVNRLRMEKYITVDTEFIRERTYWPELCLVQLAGKEDVVLVDVLAPHMTFSPLKELFADRSVIKVFHAARQDLEAILHLTGELPAPLFDTQVAAMVVGLGDQIGYDALVEAIIGVKIDKGQRVSDWSVRPLTEAQKVYGATDVTYLRPVYEALKETLERENRVRWIDEEMALLNDPSTYHPELDRVWEKLKVKTRNRRVLGVLKMVAAWREREAQRLNVPRQRVIRDESLIETAIGMPKNLEALSHVKGISQNFLRSKSAKGFLSAVEDGIKLAENRLPLLPHKKNLSHSESSIAALLKILLSEQAKKYRVIPRLIASGEDVDNLALFKIEGSKVLNGWRREVYGQKALDLLAGKIMIGVKEGHIVTVKN